MVGFEGLGSLNLEAIAKAFQAKSFFEGKSQEQISKELKKEAETLENNQRLTEIMEENSPEAQAKKQFDKRIDRLFADFDNNLPEDFKKYTTPELTDGLNATKKNIRGLADDMHKLSELAGGDPKLEQQAEKITANLLDRLKNDLGLTPEERKKLEGKSLEEIQAYYAETRSDKLDKLNETVNGYRQELHQLVEQTAGRSLEEKAKIYQDKLDELEIKTGQKKGTSD